MCSSSKAVQKTGRGTTTQQDQNTKGCNLQELRRQWVWINISCVFCRFRARGEKDPNIARSRHVRGHPARQLSSAKSTQGYTHASDQKNTESRQTLDHPRIMLSRRVTAAAAGFVFVLLPQASTAAGHHGDSTQCERLHTRKIHHSDAHCLGDDEGMERPPSCSAVRLCLWLAPPFCFRLAGRCYRYPWYPALPAVLP